MAGDEARAHEVLVAMLGRLTGEPHAVLGVPPTASPDQVRAAFIDLTKQFHPSRFGRMSPDLQRLSNEVFLGIKGAHEALMKMLGVPGRAQATGSGSVSRTASTLRMPALAKPVTPAFGVPTVPPPAAPVAQAPPPAAPSAPPADPALARVYELLDAGNWTAAKEAVTKLSARSPTSKPYKALLCYTRGREAQAAGKADEARMELERALQFDPELAVAKGVLAQLTARR